MKALIDLGWLDTEPKDWLKAGLTWAEVLQKAIGADDSTERYALKHFLHVDILHC